MYIFKHIRNPDNKYDLSNITFEVEGELALDELEPQIKSFLLACGFHPDSVMELFGEEEGE